MQYTCEIVINKPVEEVIALFDNPDYIAKWQPTFQGLEVLSGEPGGVGSKTRLDYLENGRKREMIETILTHNLPDDLTTTYETGGVFNHVSNRFIAEAPDRTRWVLESDFQFTNIPMKVIGFVMRGAFPKETQATMQRFKEFAENQ